MRASKGSGVLRALIVATFIALGMGAVSAVRPLQSASQARVEPTPVGPETILPFSSNGCSGFREAKFFSCCFVHDLAFWAGGTWSERRAADLSLRRCIKEISHNRIVADFGYFLIRLGIVPGTFINDGWGRAWRNQARGRFAPLTPEQRAIVDRERDRVCQSLILNAQTGQYRVDEVREIRANQAKEICRRPEL